MTILHQTPLQMPWITLDPFYFCVHHLDNYPEGNGELGVATSLKGRNMGSDFSGKDGWSMYHGSSIPGFPSHPHRGFETITIGRQGYIDHSDSLGAKARFGQGDVQWMTAGKGIVHSEMFPLIKTTENNPTELFQIWLNLPAQDKMVDPYFTMLWEDTIRIVDVVDDVGLHSSVQVVAGTFQEATGPTPPPNSWASQVNLTLRFGVFNLKPMQTLHYHRPRKGPIAYSISLKEPISHSMVKDALWDMPSKFIQQMNCFIEIGDSPAEILLLQGRPIGEPVAKYGPFVMNTQQELQQAFTDYQRTQFGAGHGLVEILHGLEGRFAVHADGTVERRS